MTASQHISSDFFVNMINFFIDCTRTNTTIYIVIIFFLFIFNSYNTFFIIYQKNKKIKSKIKNDCL